MLAQHVTWPGKPLEITAPRCGATRVECPRDPRERRRPHARPVAARRAGARDRGRPDRRRRRHARDGAREPGGGRSRRPHVSCPASAMRTSTSRPGRSHSGRSTSTAARRSRRRSRAIREAPAPEAGRWIRAYGWRSGDWAPAVEPTRADLDAITGTAPAALLSKDYHSLWLNSAALALANGDLEVAGGVVERDERGEPTGVLREEAAWRFKERFLRVSDDEYLEAMRGGVQARALPRRHGRPRQGRLARRARALAAAPRAGRTRHPRLAVAAARPDRRASRRPGLRSGHRRTTSSGSAT